MSISFACPSCEHGLKVRDELAGRKVKCPSCAKIVMVPAEGEEEEEPEEEERPRKKKKKKRKKKSGSTALIVGILAGVLVLGGGGVAIVLAVTSGKKEEPQAKVNKPPPADNNKDAKPQFQPKEQKGKGLVNAIARRTEATEVIAAFRQLGQAYQAASTDNLRGDGPLNYQQLGPNFSSLALKGWHEKGWIKIVWGVRLPNVQEKSNTALAWEVDADTNGQRVVLMCDMSVQTIDGPTFERMPKAMGR